ncbi:MAG TPA: DUF2723 domain-containing protein [Candidatus Eisenbacteria bacterium]
MRSTAALEPAPRSRALPALVGLAAFAFYLQLTPAISGFGDGPEFTVVLAKAGLAHPTGYPLYTLAGHLFVVALHAIGVPWAFAANAWSGAGAATAAALFFALARDLASLGPPATANRRAGSVAGLFLAAVFAVHPVLVSEATQAEVNAWSVAWTCAAGIAFLALLRRPALSRRGGALWGLVCGLGLAHHLLSVLVLAPLTAGLAWAAARRGALRPALVVTAAAAGIAPLLSYGFVAWRVFHPAPGQWPDVIPTAAGILAHVTGSVYRAYLGFFAPDRHNAEMLAWCVYPLLVPGAAFLAVALWRSRDATRRLAWGSLLAAMLAATLFVFRYGVPDPAPYFLPAVALCLLGLAPPIAALAAGLNETPVAVRWIAALLAAVVVVFFAADGVRQSAREKAQLARFDRLVRSMWEAVPPDSAIVVYPADQHRRLVEYQVLRGEKRALYVTTLEGLGEPPTRAEIRRRFGVDPMEGEAIPEVPADAAAAGRVKSEFFLRLLRDLNARVRVPVIVFDPTVPMVEALRKPGE